MRILPILFSVLFFSSILSAQMQIYPLESNSTLQRVFTEIEQERMATFVRLAGTTGFEGEAQTLDCDNIDGAFTNGETLYVVAGDSIEICYNLELYQTFKNTSSIDLAYGQSLLDSNCIKYIADSTVSIGLTDTIRVEFCADTLTGDCFSLFFPLVVKRADQSFSFPLQTFPQDIIVDICVADVQLEGPIYETIIQTCDEPLLGEVFNGNFQDSCFIYASSRFAEVDSVCFQICDDYCICDTYTYLFNAELTGASIPFMDDFSYAGPYPDEKKWLDDNVFINTTIGYQPPSVGFATFDGLDQGGTPYGGGTARADFLTSNYFSLDDSFDDLWLSFWLENKGYGYPSNPGDSLVLEFKNSHGDWVWQASADGMNMANDARPPFEFLKIKVENESLSGIPPIDTFLYDGFQFRFVNIANRSNMQDTWHLDYVVLDDGEPFGNNNDVAFGNLPSDILKRYSSMPFWHFEGNSNEELHHFASYSIVNLFSSDKSIEASFDYHRDRFSGVSLIDSFTVAEPPPTLVGGGRIDSIREVTSPFFEDLGIALDNGYAGEKEVAIDRTYILGPVGSQASSFADVLRNDTVTTTTIFDNYFAYDDGTAEAAAALGNAGWTAAVQFHANVADSIRGVQFHFPHYNSPPSSTFFNLKIWVGSLDSEPVYVKQLVKPFFVDSAYDTLQGFTTYRLSDVDGVISPVAIPAGDFYVGWQDASAASTRIGLDYNTPEAQPYQFISNGIVWDTLADLGAFMVRPMVGSEVPGTTKSIEQNQAKQEIKIFPNPARNELNFQVEKGNLTDYDLRLVDVSGKLLRQEQLSATIDISNLAGGLYFVQLTQRENQLSQTERIVVVR